MLSRFPALLGGVSGLQSAAAWAIGLGGSYWLYTTYTRPAPTPAAAFSDKERDEWNARRKAETSGAGGAAAAAR